MGPGSAPRGWAVGGGRALDTGRPKPRQEASPPRAPSCRPHSAQSQLEGARAVGLVTGRHARTPPHPQPVGGWPLQAAQRAGRRGWESARPRTPYTQARGAPPGTLMPPPQHARARAVGLVTGPHARTPPHPQPVGSGPRQPAQRAGTRGWESARPRTSHTQAGGAPPWAPSCRPHSAQSQLARARSVGLVMGPHAHTPPAATASG